jgi:hypothetical protein
MIPRSRGECRPNDSEISKLICKSQLGLTGADLTHARQRQASLKLGKGQTSSAANSMLSTVN